MADVRRLRLQQLQQLFTSETDATQALEWIEELADTVTKRSGAAGEGELEALDRELRKLERTARDTFDYGEELVQVSLVLRRSLRLEVTPQLALARRLEDSWALFCRALSTAHARLSIRSSFYSTANQVHHRLDDLCDKVSTSGDESPNTATVSSQSSPNQPTLKNYEDVKKQLNVEVRELRAMAETLIQRSEKSQSEEEQAALKEMQRRLGQIEAKQTELETLWKGEREVVKELVKERPERSVYTAKTQDAPPKVYPTRALVI